MSLNILFPKKLTYSYIDLDEKNAVLMQRNHAFLFQKLTLVTTNLGLIVYHHYSNYG